MKRWCEVQATTLDVDWVLWTRRPEPQSPFPEEEYAQLAQACQKATGARMMVILPPISTFDLSRKAHHEEEGRRLREILGTELPLIELTGVFRAAQEGRGETLVQDEGKLKVVDQETDRVWLEAPAQEPQNLDKGTPLDPAIYELFETHPEVREALFFDESHPDEEGYVLFGVTVGEALTSLWKEELPGH